MNVVHTCSLKWPAAHVWFSPNFLHSSPAICWICFPMDDTQNSDSAVQSTKVLREPIQTIKKWTVKICFNASHLYALPSAMAVPFQNSSYQHCTGGMLHIQNGMVLCLLLSLPTRCTELKMDASIQQFLDDRTPFPSHNLMRTTGGTRYVAITRYWHY